MLSYPSQMFKAFCNGIRGTAALSYRPPYPVDAFCKHFANTMIRMTCRPGFGEPQLCSGAHGLARHQPCDAGTENLLFYSVRRTTGRSPPRQSTLKRDSIHAMLVLKIRCCTRVAKPREDPPPTIRRQTSLILCDAACNELL